MESVPSVFSPWAVFYTITGSSAAALTGLMFVVITIMKDTGRTSDGLATVSTAIVVHFTAALMISGLLCAPWPTVLWPAAILGLLGVAGVSYQIRVYLVTQQAAGDYVPDIEDRIWYTILPTVAYAVIFAGAIALAIAPTMASYAPAGAVALLLLIGIHNSWDVVTFITIANPTPPEQK